MFEWSDLVKLTGTWVFHRSCFASFLGFRLLCNCKTSLPADVASNPGVCIQNLWLRNMKVARSDVHVMIQAVRHVKWPCLKELKLEVGF